MSSFCAFFVGPDVATSDSVKRMGRAQSDSQRGRTRTWHTLVQFALVVALLALRSTPPDLTLVQAHEVVKQSAAHDKRPCVQRSDTEFDSSGSETSVAPVLSEFDLFHPHPGSKARECNTALCNRPPPLV